MGILVVVEVDVYRYVHGYVSRSNISKLYLEKVDVPMALMMRCTASCQICSRHLSAFAAFIFIPFVKLFDILPAQPSKTQHTHIHTHTHTTKRKRKVNVRK